MYHKTLQQNSLLDVYTQAASRHIQPAVSCFLSLGDCGKLMEIQLQILLNEQTGPHPSWTLLEKSMLSRKVQLASKSLHSSARNFMWVKESFLLPSLCSNYIKTVSVTKLQFCICKFYDSTTVKNAFLI